MLRDVAWRPAVLRERARWSETGDIALVQLVVSVLVGADVVLVALLGSGTAAEAGFQALATLAKGPVYVAAGAVLVAFPLLRAARRTSGTEHDGVADVLRTALHSFTSLALAAAVVLATVPTALVALILPAAYVGSVRPGARSSRWPGSATAPSRCSRPCCWPCACTRGRASAWPRPPSRSPRGSASAGPSTASPASRWVPRWAPCSRPPCSACSPHLCSRPARQATSHEGSGVAAVLLGVLVLVAPIPLLWLACAAAGGLLSLRPDLVRRKVAPMIARRGARVGRGTGRPSGSAADRGVVLALLLGLVALQLRAIGLGRANDLFIDEVTYAHLADTVASGQLPNQDGVPFFLHPIGSFVLNGLVIRLFGLHGDAMDLVFDLRWVNAVLGAVTVVLAVLVVRRLAGFIPAAVAGLVLAFDPFVLRMDGRLMIETPAMLAVLAGWTLLLAALDREPARRGPGTSSAQAWCSASRSSRRT